MQACTIESQVKRSFSSSNPISVVSSPLCATSDFFFSLSLSLFLLLCAMSCRDFVAVTLRQSQSGLVLCAWHNATSPVVWLRFWNRSHEIYHERFDCRHLENNELSLLRCKYFSVSNLFRLKRKHLLQKVCLLVGSLFIAKFGNLVSLLMLMNQFGKKVRNWVKVGKRVNGLWILV